MIATTRIHMHDLAQQKHLDTDLSNRITPEHSVANVIDHFLTSLSIPSNGQRWSAMSRGALLDRKALLADVPESLDDWTIIPEVSAG